MKKNKSGTWQKCCINFILFIGTIFLLCSVYANDHQPALVTGNWPQFRGVQASGLAEGKGAPIHWNNDEGTNILWKTPIPGLGHSSPVIWGNQIFITTVVAEGHEEPYLRIGLWRKSGKS